MRLIDADALLKAMETDVMGGLNYQHFVKEAPTIEPMEGEWIIKIDANNNTYGRCSICGMKQYAGRLNFCPNCGAHMEGITDE